jgi:hypothetical protein
MAKKKQNKNDVDESHPLNHPLPTNLALVHIGKTAGSTISTLLANGCNMLNPHPCKGRDVASSWYFGVPGESKISELTKGYYHFTPVTPVGMKKKHDEHDGYIIPIRNPVDRVVSAYFYVHPLNVERTTGHRGKWLNSNRGKGNLDVEEYDLFYKCFPTIDDLADGLSRSDDCGLLGRKVLSGGPGLSIRGSEMLNHFGFGYQYYAYNLLENGDRIFALRQEHLKNDWRKFNSQLGGDPHDFDLKSKDFKSELAAKLDDGGLRETARRKICEALREEVAVYQNVVLKAENLSNEEKEETMKEIREGCSY